MWFFVGDDVIFDCEFFLYDIIVSKVYVEGLQYIGVVSVDEVVVFKCELDVLVEDFCFGVFVLDECFEDCYFVIEVWFIEWLGDVGCCVYIGCSCNDQILVVMWLWLKDKLVELEVYCCVVVEVCLECVVQLVLLMLGYIYLQCVVVLFIVMWFVGFVEGFIDNVLCVW